MKNVRNIFVMLCAISFLTVCGLTQANDDQNSNTATPVASLVKEKHQCHMVRIKNGGLRRVCK